MTKRSPDKREQNRLKKIEQEKQRKRYLAASFIKEGMTIREAAEKVGMSTFFVMEWRDRLLDCVKRRISVKGGGLRTVRTYRWKKGLKELLATRRPGPKPGGCPKV